MSKPHKIKIGLLGLGTVGSGVYKLIEKQKEEFCKKAGADVEIVKILVHNMEKKREGVDPALLTDHWRDIIDNDEIRLVIEVMGELFLPGGNLRLRSAWSILHKAAPPQMH